MKPDVGFFSEGTPARRQRRYLSSFVKYNISRGYRFNNQEIRVRESDLATLSRQLLRLQDTHCDDPDQPRGLLMWLNIGILPTLLWGTPRELRNL